MINTLFIFGAKYLYLVVVGVAAVYFFTQSRVIQKQIIIFGMITLPIAYVLAKIAGYFYYDPRPFVVNHFTPLISHTADNGFPSDHTLLSAAIAVILYPFNKKLSGLVWALALLVGWSRVYVGVHHPVDIAGSIIIAIFSAWVVSQIIKKLNENKGK